MSHKKANVHRYRVRNFEGDAFGGENLFPER